MFILYLVLSLVSKLHETNVLYRLPYVSYSRLMIQIQILKLRHILKKRDLMQSSGEFSTVRKE